MLLPYWDQIERGMFFLHKHPTASSWNVECVMQLIMAHPGVYVVTGDGLIGGGVEFVCYGTHDAAWIGYETP